MKKTIAVFVMAMFVLSIFPLVYAEDDTTTNDPPGTDAQSGKRVLGPVGAQRIEQIKQNNEIRKETVKSFEECVKAAKEQYPNSSEQKIAQNCKNRTGFVTGNEQIKARLENLGQKDRAGVALKLAEKNPKLSEMIANMTDKEAKNFLELNREQQKNILKEGKKALLGYKVEKVAKEKAFKKREVAKDKLDNAKEKFAKAEEKYNNAKENYKNAKDNFEKAIKSGNDTDAKKYAKEFLANAADQVISALEKIKENANANEDLAESEVASIISDANKKIAEMESAKTALSDATTKEEIKTAGKEIIKAWEKAKLSIKLHAAKAVESKVGEIIKRSESLERKLERVLADMEAKGIDTSSIDSKIDEFSAKVSEAKTLFSEGRELFINAKEIRIKGNLTQAEKADIEKYMNESKTKISLSHEALKEAHVILMDIVKEVKQKGGNIEIADEDTEVQVTNGEEEALDEREQELNEQEVEENESDVGAGNETTSTEIETEDVSENETISTGVNETENREEHVNTTINLESDVNVTAGAVA